MEGFTANEEVLWVWEREGKKLPARVVSYQGTTTLIRLTGRSGHNPVKRVRTENLERVRRGSRPNGRGAS